MEIQTQFVILWLKKLLSTYLILCCVAGVAMSYRWSRAVLQGRDEIILLSCFMTETQQIERELAQNQGTNQQNWEGKIKAPKR
jgi:hypothetical protein